MIEALTEPLTHEFFRRALAEIILIGIAAGALGTWIVLFRLSYTSESLAHGLLPGLVLAALAGVPLILGATPALLVAAAAIALISRVPRVEADAAIGITVTGLLGLGALLALSAESPPGLSEILFGDILATDSARLRITGAMTLTVAVGLWALHPRLSAAAFDPAGRQPAWVGFVLMLLIAFTILVGVQAMGNLLLVAVLIGPAATARLLTNRLWPMVALAALFAVGLGAAGLYLSYYAGTAAGASVALTMLVGFLVAALARGPIRLATMAG